MKMCLQRAFVFAICSILAIGQPAMAGTIGFNYPTGGSYSASTGISFTSNGSVAPTGTFAVNIAVDVKFRNTGGLLWDIYGGGNKSTGALSWSITSTPSMIAIVGGNVGLYIKKGEYFFKASYTAVPPANDSGQNLIYPTII